MAVAKHFGHSFDLDLLLSARYPTAIDVGCREFEMARLLGPLNVRVHSVDIDAGVLEWTKGKDLFRYEFHQVAIMGYAEAARQGGRTGVTLCGNGSHTDGPEDSNPVRAVGIRQFMFEIGLGRVDLLKLDCEGSEYGILDDLIALDRPVARQITVEYHEHSGRLPEGGAAWIDEVADRLRPLYEIVKHNREPKYHMDCLYIARGW